MHNCLTCIYRQILLDNESNYIHVCANRKSKNFLHELDANVPNCKVYCKTSELDEELIKLINSKF